MPRQVTTDVVPARVAAAGSAFGTSLRLGILRTLTDCGPQTLTELAGHLRVPARTTLLANVEALEVVGAVSADQAPGTRQGRTIRYTVDARRLAELHADLGAYLGIP